MDASVDLVLHGELSEVGKYEHPKQKPAYGVEYCDGANKA